MPTFGYKHLLYWFGLCCFLATSAAQARNLPDFTELVEEQSPAVVKIETEGRIDQSQSFHQGEEIPEMFREFFERRSRPERDFQSMGSGFLISDDGYILTNNHVVENADEIRVRLIDRREFSADVVGTDPRSDLALLKIDAKRLPHLEFAESDSVKVGEWVLAIGSPFGLDYSVSAGIVSAIGRSIPGAGESNYVPFIQTDVAINPGHSGGPLFNLDGEVVGINSQIYTRSGGSIGLSFAIPAGLAQEVVAQLRDKGRVERGWLGVVIQEVNRDLARSFGLKKSVGALISQMDPEGPAAQSDLRVGDIILTFDGQAVEQSGDLPPLVGRVTPGTEVPVEVMRRGERRTLDVEIGTLPVEQAQATPSRDPGGPGDPLGLKVEPVPEGADEAGVLVSDVSRDSAAARAGLRPGDVITQLGYDTVDSVERYRELVADMPKGEPVAVRFLRQGQPAFTTLQID
ncbi:DegQ family serine endoprotease [Marinimicrobium sp. C2-29]|uniref:DegQ family serine endoprotease n=1 Tax=Marinimicrobium sp. C2-29 TaxID=3139825 RepID=UPI003139AC59